MVHRDRPTTALLGGLITQLYTLADLTIASSTMSHVRPAISPARNVICLFPRYARLADCSRNFRTVYCQHGRGLSFGSLLGHQFLFRQFPYWRLGQACTNFHLGRHFVLRELIGQEGLQFVDPKRRDVPVSAR